jgi:hypothetical protein
MLLASVTMQFRFVLFCFVIFSNSCNLLNCVGKSSEVGYNLLNFIANLLKWVAILLNFIANFVKCVVANILQVQQGSGSPGESEGAGKF